MRPLSILIYLVVIAFLLPTWPVSLADTEPSPNAAPFVDPYDLGRLPVRVFNDRDGLPQIVVNTIVFDKRGYLWVGTQDGAAYYNGRNWTVVNMPHSNQSNWVTKIVVGSDGSIWFANYIGGIARLKDNQWTVYDNKNGLPDNKVNTLLETVGSSGKKVILAGTANGLARFENERWFIDDQLDRHDVKDLVEAISDNGARILYAATYSGLKRYENDRWSAVTFSADLLSNEINCLLATKAENGRPVLWIGTENGLARAQENRLERFDTTNGLPDKRVIALAETLTSDGTRTLWAGTMAGGLARYERGRWTSFGLRNGLSSNRIVSLQGTVHNGSRVLWIGTFGGLLRYKLGRWMSFDTRNGLPDNLVWSVYETVTPAGDSIYWFGTSSGLARLENGNWTVYGINSGLPDNIVYSIYESPAFNGKRTLWVGTSNGLAQLQNGKWRIFDKSTGLPHNKIFTITETYNDNGAPILWVGTAAGLCRYENDQWTVYGSKEGLPNGNVQTIIETVGEDRSKTLWIGTRGGLARLRNGKLTTFDPGLSNNFIFSLLATKLADGTPALWLGTKGGAFRLNLKTNQLTHFSDADSSPIRLPNNTVAQIREDGAKRIYLFTLKGIVQLTPRLPTDDDASVYGVYTFKLEDGVPGGGVLQGASYIDSKGRIMAGTVEGATVFDPKQLVIDRTLKPLVVENILLAGKARQIENSSLAYNENNLTFEFALLSYFRESETQYRTQLVGLEDEPSAWTSVSRRDFNYLPAGDYLFKIWARDYVGNITGPREIAFTVRPAPWRTWWAIIIYCGLVAGAGYTGVRLRLRALQRSNEALEEKVRLRTAELANKNTELAKKNEELIRSKEELERSHKQAELIFTALSDVLPGTVLDGKYQLDVKIGAGGFGAVFRATHLGLSRPVAVKIFRPALGNTNKDALKRFQLEGVSTCRINHPNAVAVLDSGVTAEGIAYLVMELLEGHSLKAELRAHGKLSPLRTARIIIPICEALEEAHAQGIVHRDIKPDNIFLHQTRLGEVVKVVDFGIAKLVDDSIDSSESLTETGGILGTPTYMAPERFTSETIDGRTDVYSVGIMAYEMLTGHPPFKILDNKVYSVIMQHMSEPPPSLRSIEPDVPVEVEKIVLDALIKDPKLRPTAKEVAEALAAVFDIDMKQYSGGAFMGGLADPSTSGVRTLEMNAETTGTITGSEETLRAVISDTGTEQVDKE